VKAARIGSRNEPEIPDELATLSVSLRELYDDASWADVSVNDAQLSGAQAQRLAILGSRLTKVNFAESSLPALRAADVVFTDCNFSNVQIADSSFRRVSFSQTKFTGMQTSKTTFSDVAFRNCRMDLTTFGDTRFKNVTFDECFLREADFSETSFDRVRFVGCDLGRSLFTRTHTQHSEMRQCKLTELRGLDQLRGIAMEWNDILGNAEVFAAELGIEIIDDSSERDR